MLFTAQNQGFLKQNSWFSNNFLKFLPKNLSLPCKTLHHLLQQRQEQRNPEYHCFKQKKKDQKTEKRF